MTPVVWAQAMAEYGVMAAITARISSVYTQVELSLRTDTEMWLLGGGAVLLCYWLLGRR